MLWGQPLRHFLVSAAIIDGKFYFVRRIQPQFCMGLIFRLGGGLIFLGIFFSYTRAAYVALAMTVGAYWVIRWKLVKPVLVGAAICKSSDPC